MVWMGLFIFALALMNLIQIMMVKQLNKELEKYKKEEQK